MTRDPILILDDDTAILMALQETVKAEGYSYFATTKASEALDAVRQKQFAIVISDQRMAEMPGIQFLSKVKQIQPFCVRILITGVLTSEMFLEAINTAEVSHCLPKPWTQQTLLKTIQDSYEAFERNIAYPRAIQSLRDINRQLIEENNQLRRSQK